jgi:type I restriction enzyme S subunit
MTIPHQEILLRWTTALDAKWKKGLDYRSKGVIKPEDAYVIAIDGSQLGYLPLSHGASRQPYIVEATFAVGPLALEFEPENGRVIGPRPTVRLGTKNKNNAPVRTEAFLNQAYSSVSAAIGCVPPMFSAAILPLQVAYNPRADVSLKPGCFGKAAEEWAARLVSADEEGEEWELQPIAE